MIRVAQASACSDGFSRRLREIHQRLTPFCLLADLLSSQSNPRLRLHVPSKLHHHRNISIVPHPRRNHDINLKHPFHQPRRRPSIRDIGGRNIVDEHLHRQRQRSQRSTHPRQSAIASPGRRLPCPSSIQHNHIPRRLRIPRPVH